MNYCLQDGVLPFGECIVLGAVGLGLLATLADGTVWLWNKIFPSDQSETVMLNSKIDWNSGDHNHIIDGSKVNGDHNWGKFGLDPKDPKIWEKRVPFLKTVADYGAQYGPPEHQSTGTVYKFIYDFSDKGASIVLKLFYHNNGNISISDAWPIP